jgi:putative membrane protein
MSQPAEKFLVLCVDRDDDLGFKAKVETPVIGRAEVAAAAMRLALVDPEEADANAMFAAVKKYDEIAKTGASCEVAVVCGDVDRGFKADRRVAKEVAGILAGGGYSGVVLVSDGGEDEQVLPVIQSMKPIVSVERVTVKHSQTVEETYEVLGRYLRMLVFDPHYSRWSLGVPGLILLLAGILIVAGRVLEAELATLLILGGAFLIRGFNVDRTVAGLLHRGPTGFLRLFSAVASLLIVIVGISTGYLAVLRDTSAVAAVSADPGKFLVYGPTLIGLFIGGGLALVWGGIAVYATGGMLSHLARDSKRWRRDAFVLVMLAILYLPVWTFSDFLVNQSAEFTYLLISYVLIGLAVIFAITTLIYPRVRTRNLGESG